uniref:Uncharacterized protein n=1 Tax=Octopus bimaculoides TaxID=37653 RepID=A0A0L8I2A1_OCTBM
MKNVKYEYRNHQHLGPCLLFLSLSIFNSYSCSWKKKKKRLNTDLKEQQTHPCLLLVRFYKICVFNPLVLSCIKRL